MENACDGLGREATRQLFGLNMGDLDLHSKNLEWR